MKIITENKEDNIDIIIKDDEVIIEGLELRPYWKRISFLLFWWKEPKFIIKNPKVFFNRKSKGEKIALFG